MADDPPRRSGRVHKPRVDEDFVYGEIESEHSSVESLQRQGSECENSGVNDNSGDQLIAGSGVVVVNSECVGSNKVNSECVGSNKVNSTEVLSPAEDNLVSSSESYDSDVFVEDVQVNNVQVSFADGCSPAAAAAAVPPVDGVSPRKQ